MFLSRREFAVGMAALDAADAAKAVQGKLKVVVAGAHPGDPECGCAGTVARYTELGHEAILLYFNRGEGFCKGADPSQCGAVRTVEAQKACAILQARPVFAGQYDGRSVVDNVRYDEFRAVLNAEKPDIVFCHWPMDRHRDHRAMSMLVLDAWLKESKRAALYFFEVADDTMMFSPSEYVDISGVEQRRQAACYAHASQQPEKWYPRQVEITRFRGTESGLKQAEAFVRHWESRRGLLP